jgi:hypothetical protein
MGIRVKPEREGENLLCGVTRNGGRAEGPVIMACRSVITSWDPWRNSAWKEIKGGDYVVLGALENFVLKIRMARPSHFCRLPSLWEMDHRIGPREWVELQLATQPPTRVGLPRRGYPL